MNVSTIQTISQSLGTDVGPHREWPLKTRGNNANTKGGSPIWGTGILGKIIDVIEILPCISGDQGLPVL